MLETFLLAFEAGHSEGAIPAWVVGVIALVALLALLIGLVGFAAGRDHS